MTHDQHQTRKANEESERALAGLSRDERERLDAAGVTRRQAVEATPAGSYRSLRAVENDGRDKVEFSDRPR